jgi:multiple sugar transport system substrate-binding protein
LADVTDVVDELGKGNGGWYDFTKQFANADGKWRSVPNSVGTGAFVYRTDWFKQNNVSAPKTWDEFMKTAVTLKKFGKPIGQALGHSFGDPPGFWYPWLWSHGGKEVAEDGKTVIINSPETISSLERAIELYKTGLVEAGIAWDDTSNNRSYLAEEISCTNNGSSIYFVMAQNAAKTPADEAAKRLFENSNHFAMPAGPKGTYTLGGLYSVGIMSYSKQINAAKDFMRWYMEPARFTNWLDSGKGYLVGAAKTFENAPIFKTDPKMAPFLENFIGDKVKWLGWPGPLSAAAYRVFNNQTIVDMYAKACIGEFNPKAAATWAEGQLKGVYK